MNTESVTTNKGMMMMMMMGTQALVKRALNVLNPDGSHVNEKKSQIIQWRKKKTNGRNKKEIALQVHLKCDTSQRPSYTCRDVQDVSMKKLFHRGIEQQYNNTCEMNELPYSTSYSLGTIRDRTGQFISWREKAKKFSSASVYNTNGQGEYTETTSLLFDKDVERGSAPEGNQQDSRIFKLRSDVQQNMDSIRALMEEIRTLHGKASLNTFDDDRDDELAVEVATQQITSLFRSCEKSLQECGASWQGAGSHSMERTIQENMQKTLALDLQKLSLEFRKQQKAYLMRLRERDGRNSAAANALGLLNDEQSYSQMNSSLSELQSMVVETSSAMIQERDREVMKIVASIHDLGQIMKDLSTLVIEQGTVLDRIDYTLQQTSSVVDQGVSQLKRAEKAQRRGLLASCVLILLAIIAVLFVILIVKSILL